VLSVDGELLLLEGLLLELFSVVLPVGLVPLVASFFEPIEPTASGERALWSRWRFADRARAMPFCLSLRTWSTLRSFVEALLSAVAAESPTLEDDESELFAEIDESELFVAEVSELCGVAESVDELAVGLESSLLR
jgi:hypothetical protein